MRETSEAWKANERSSPSYQFFPVSMICSSSLYSFLLAANVNKNQLNQKLMSGET